MKISNKLLLEYHLLLEYKRAEELILIENFVDSISDSFEIIYEDSVTIEDILESVEGLDFSDNKYFFSSRS